MRPWPSLASVIPALALSLALGACRGGSSSGVSALVSPAAGTATASATAGAASPVGSSLVATPSPAASDQIGLRLAAGALSLADFPGGWEALPSTNDQSTSGPCGVPKFDRSDAKLGEIGVGFAADDGGPFVTQHIAIFPVDIASQAMSYARDATNCAEWTETAPSGEQTIYRVSPLENPAVGDESFAVRVTFDVEGAGTLVSDTVFVRVQDAVSVIVYSQLGQTDQQQFGTIVRTAVEKLTEAAGALP